MNIVIAFLSALISYLIGGISFSRVVTRLLAPDVKLEDTEFPSVDGSEGYRLHTIGATTASLELGPRVGCTIGLLDILKGVLPTLILRFLYPGEFYFLIAAVFALVGHNWPVYYRFRGGAGISTIFGGFFVVDFIGTIVSLLAGMIFGLLIIRDVMVTYVSGLWFMLLWLIILKGDWPYIVYGIVVNILFAIAHIPDARAYLEKKRDGTLDMGASMEQFPMGRGMLKIMGFFGVEPRVKSTKNDN